LAIALLDVVEGPVTFDSAVVVHPLLDDGQRAKRFGEDGELVHQHAHLTGARAHHGAGGLHEVAQVQVALDHVVSIIAHVVDAHEQLHAPGAVLDVREVHLALQILAHDAPADGDLDRLGGFGIARLERLKSPDSLHRGMRARHAVGVGGDAALIEALQALPSIVLRSVGRLPHGRCTFSLTYPGQNSAHASGGWHGRKSRPLSPWAVIQSP